MDNLLTLSQFEYFLPPDLIAQEPCPERELSRLMILDRKNGELQHRRFNEIIDYLLPGDLLVVNDTQVIPARLEGKKVSGGKVECLLLNYPNPSLEGSVISPCLLKAGGKIRPGDRIIFGKGLEGEILPPSPNGKATIRLRFEGDFATVLNHFGKVPLPPYIRRRGQDARLQEEDRVRYQTVYARIPGAIAAPTAGFHFSPNLIMAIKAKGIGWVPLTLHVGYGTFAPVKEETITEHKIHPEAYRITASAVDKIRQHQKQGGRIIAVGTTSVRVLEHLALTHGEVKAFEGFCDLFITPGFQFKVVDVLIKNFHLPKTTLLMLVSALAGRGPILRAYQEAVKQRYRFYSYGDAMLII